MLLLFPSFGASRGLTRVCWLALCRFYYYNSYKDFHPHLIGATALYLASKVEEHPVTPKAIALAGSQVIAGNQVKSRAHALRARRRGRTCRAHTARVWLACRRLRLCCCCWQPLHPPLPSHNASSAMLRVAASERGEEIPGACNNTRGVWSDSHAVSCLMRLLTCSLITPAYWCAGC